MIIRNLEVANDRPFTLIAGPCQIESRLHALRTVGYLREFTNSLGIPFIYKSSFDKANRTAVSSQRGVGFREGLDILAEIRSHGVATTTDFHTVNQIDAFRTNYFSAVDLVQIPAFLCRQTDLLLAAGRTNLPVNVKKGQFCAPEDIKYAVEKIQSTGNHQVMVTERGTCFGYHNLVVDFRSIPIMSQFAPICFDATHSVQLPSIGGQSGGTREYVRTLALAAVAIGVAAIFLECHEDPDNAPSDGPCMIPLRNMKKLLQEMKTIDDVVKNGR